MVISYQSTCYPVLVCENFSLSKNAKLHKNSPQQKYTKAQLRETSLSRVLQMFMYLNIGKTQNKSSPKAAFT